MQKSERKRTVANRIKRDVLARGLKDLDSTKMECLFDSATVRLILSAGDGYIEQEWFCYCKV